jgi:DNA (cytosine-5)-methyltransferase 1
MSINPIVIDVFSGVGGLSLGAARAGFKIAAAVELDERALSTHKTNFPNTAHLRKDVGLLSANALLTELSLHPGSVDGLIGGPPCQGFSHIGRQDANDPRNSLFGKFFGLVAELRPAFFLAENVPGLLADRNTQTRLDALSLVPKDYRLLQPIKVKANDYGAPTTRTRIFFIGYDPTRVAAMTEADFLPKPTTDDVRVADALRQLPKLRSHWATLEESWRSVGELGDSAFEQRIKDAVPDMIGDKDAIRLYRNKRLASGFLGTVHTPGTIERFSLLRFGEFDAVSKGTRLDPDGYCPTLRAGTGPERGSFQAVRPIHPRSPRVICPREAARLQGFPDWFQFHPTKWHAFRQIGNSVSPIVAEALLSVIRSRLP